MTYLPIPRIVTPMGRLPWYRQVNWHFIGAILFCLAVWAVIFWSLSLAVKS